MATNDFKPFATGPAANVTSQSDYEALAALLTGFQSGKASSSQINKALRQSSTMAAVIGQFISQASIDALDNGNITTLLNNFISAITTNLSLGTASKRGVGTGANQIPDMSSFIFNRSGTDISNRKITLQLPNGFILKVVNGNADNNGYFFQPFDQPFPNAVLFAWAADRAPTSNANQTSTVWPTMQYTTNQYAAAQMRSVLGGGVSYLAGAVSFFAIGY
ncbi:gp53-like domain-containing protein [Pantoea septica]|uniref:gp53-like domain-containing protein n=1 Tax=Pantoea septica TaxID=472695 RepID=UPI00209CCA3B|nr:hypothetical protein [Pantoea septica]